MRSIFLKRFELSPSLVLHYIKVCSTLYKFMVNREIFTFFEVAMGQHSWFVSPTKMDTPKKVLLMKH